MTTASETRAVVFRWLSEEPTVALTAPELSRLTGYEATKVYSALYGLMDEGRVRKAGITQWYGATLWERA